MPDSSDPYEALNLPPELVEVLVRALGYAFLTVQPLFMHPHDPVPHELMTRFGLTYEALTAYGHHDSETSLRLALIDEVPTYTYYALAAQQVLRVPALAEELRAVREAHQPGADDWDGYADLMHTTLEALVVVSASVAAGGDAELAAANLLVQRGEIAGLFARLEHTLRPGPLPAPPAPNSTAPWTLSAEDRWAAQMAVRLPAALIPLADSPFTRGLNRLARLEVMPTFLLQMRLDALPPADDPVAATLDLSPDDLLLLWQGAEVGLMAMYGPVTPYGTWEDYLMYGPVDPAHGPSPVRKLSHEARAADHAEGCASLQGLLARLRPHLAATHPGWAGAEAEIAALRETL